MATMFKRMGLAFICLVFLAHHATASEGIYKLSQEDHARMPPKLRLDRYLHCLDQPNGVYCTATAAVVSDEPSELLDMMKGYSDFSRFHYNHTELRYGLCMTRHCRDLYTGDAEPELIVAAEGCLNRSLSEEYGLKTRVTAVNCYYEDDTKNKHHVDSLDRAIMAFFLAVFALNFIGSFYDFTRDPTKPGNKFLLSFSWRRNWRELMAPPSSDPRAAALQSLNGIRFLTCLLIVSIHAPIPTNISPENTDFMEKGAKTTDFYIPFSGHTFTQSFFLMSGFLLVYNTLLATEKQPFTLKSYFKSIFLRIIRLAPLSYTSLMITVSFLRLAGHGPLWQEQAGIEVDDCRQYWIYNVLFLNNFFDKSTCKLEAWSTASDFHLHIIGLTVILLAKTETRRRLLLGLLYLVGVVLPAYNVYTMELDGTFVARPEHAATYYKHYDTFHYLYKRTYSNIPVFIIGMVFGQIVFEMQKKNVTPDFTKYRYAYWALLPFLYCLMNAGGFIFYQQEPAGLFARLAFMPVMKTLYGLTVVLIIFGAVNKVESLYRGVLEWRGFVPLGKLSFGVYTLHMVLIRHVAATDSTLHHNAVPHIVLEMFGFIALSTVFALVMHLSVEAPAVTLGKMLFRRAPAEKKEEKKQ